MMSVVDRLTIVELELFFLVMAVLIPFLMSLMLCYATHVHIPARFRLGPARESR